MIFARTLSKARIVPIAGLLALTAVSAALAQTIEGIDLKAIKDRATEATADAQKRREIHCPHRSSGAVHWGEYGISREKNG